MQYNAYTDRIILHGSKIEGTPGIIGEHAFYLKRPEINPCGRER